MTTEENSNRKRILVVEDEPSISQLCQTVLTSEGFEVDIAADGRVAQEMIEKKRYDLCLIDVKIPAMNGKELYQWITEKYPELVKGVVFTTGDVMSGDTPSFLQRVARPFMTKPFTPADLKAIIQRALQGEP